jgi:hypothetical protein
MVDDRARSSQPTSAALFDQGFDFFFGADLGVFAGPFDGSGVGLGRGGGGSLVGCGPVVFGTAAIPVCFRAISEVTGYGDPGSVSGQAIPKV